MQRNIAIDMLRGIAILAMILIHTSYYFIADKFVWLLWNWSQFAVPVFLFCSGYAFFVKDRANSWQDFRLYLQKRLQRLILPYYLFLLFFLPIIWFIYPVKVTAEYIWQSIVVIGGVDISWLVLLMLELAIVLPLISYLKKSIPRFFWSYIILGGVFSLLVNHVALHVSYKLIMWLPWSLISIASYVVITNKQIIRQIVFFVSLITFVLIYFITLSMHQDVSLINNKYPPTLLMLSFGVWTSLLLYWLAEKKLFAWCKKFLSFLSQHSYAIYFIHYCILISTVPLIKILSLHWYDYFLVVLLATLFAKYFFIDLWDQIHEFNLHSRMNNPRLK